jgi:hypothetical protein
MPVADPNLIRQAAAQFQPRRSRRFGNLQPCQDVILELREKGASCEAIAELLTRYGVKTSRTMVNEYVRTLCPPKSVRRRKPRLNPATPVATPTSPPPSIVFKPVAPADPESDANGTIKARGPRIAKIELVKPDEQYD